MSNGSEVLNAIGNFYREDAKDEINDFYLEALGRLRGYPRGSLADIYGRYLKKVSPKVWKKGVVRLEELASYTSGYGRSMIVNTLEDLSNDLSTKISDAKAKGEELKKNKSGQNEIDAASREADELTTRQNDLKDRIGKLKTKENE